MGSVFSREVEEVGEDREVEEVVAMLHAPGGLSCPSAPALPELLLPRMFRRQRSAVVGEARRHLPTLGVYRPATLFHLLPLGWEEVEVLLSCRSTPPPSPSSLRRSLAARRFQ